MRGRAAAAFTGTLESMAWPAAATTLVVPVRQDGQLLVATAPAVADLGLPAGAANTAGEPEARRVRLDSVPVAELALASIAYEAAVETLTSGVPWPARCAWPPPCSGRRS